LREQNRIFSNPSRGKNVLVLYIKNSYFVPMDTLPARHIHKGRGAATNAVGRFEAYERAPVDDGWGSADEPALPIETILTEDSTRTIIARNQSPDIPFDRSINPYRGSEHGCIYGFARPTHAYLGLSPGLDFESKLLVKPEAA